ncbi:hypothetical protein [Burkholderia gladioli]|uniref:hypothetical protein n=1 Tax=Burkholderia gladioli TaxID=28095 RepID=UPI0026515D1C|nr:hypothetical protein [Burkholderia gladioli]MDN7922127.1 hypothetical protein [Burkholderia gladioli]
MKEPQPKHIVMAALFAACALVLVFTHHDADDELVEATPRPAQPSVAQAAPRGADAERGAAAAPGTVAIAAIRARAERGDAGAHALFNTLMLAPPLPSAAPAQVDVPPLPNTPAMPFTYLGKQLANGHWEVYLARGDDTLIVHEQMVIDGTYKVDAIAPPNLTLVYLPQKLVQTLDIGSAD